jgi:hypothetical protein
VVLEGLAIPAANEFLSELSSLRIAEMPISPRVATLSLVQHRKQFSSNTLRKFEFEPLPILSGPFERQYQEITFNTKYEILKLAA